MKRGIEKIIPAIVMGTAKVFTLFILGGLATLYGECPFRLLIYVPVKAPFEINLCRFPCRYGDGEIKAGKELCLASHHRRYTEQDPLAKPWDFNRQNPISKKR